MRAYVLPSNQRIEPFKDLARDISLGVETVTEAQTRIMRQQGLERVEVASPEEIPSDAPCVVTYDNVYVSRVALFSFLARWKKKEAVQLALPEDAGFVREFSSLQGLEREGGRALFRVYGVPAGARFGQAAPRPLEVFYRHMTVTVPAPPHVEPTEIRSHSLTGTVVFHLRHWLHVLELGRLAVQLRWVETGLWRPWVMGWIFAKALPPWPGRGSFKWRLFASANRVAWSADVHPTARVEGSFIAPGAQIGAQTFLRGAVIGPGAVIEDRAVVCFSTIGPRCYVAKSALVYGSVLMERAHAGVGLQFGLLGRRAVLAPRSLALDLNLAGPIRVLDGDALVELPHRLLGPCLGHEAFVGPDVFVAPGRALPNGALVGPDPERILASVPLDRPPGRYGVVRGGRLVDP